MLTLASVGSARHLSFFSAKPAETVETAQAAVATVPEPAVSASAATVPEVPLSTPVPSSDMPALASETGHAAGTVDHLTSSAPDHQFHSDPSSLLPQAGANGQTPTLIDLVNNSGLPLEDVLNAPEAVHAAVAVKDLKEIGLDHYFFSIPGWLCDSLVGFHNLSGLPWWASIMGLTVMVRLAISPKVVSNMRHNVRLQAVGPQMRSLMKMMTDAKKSGDTPTQQVATQHLQQLFKDNDVSPFRPITMMLIQTPFFLSMFYGMRRLADLPFPAFKEGGFSWITDLTVADPYCVLPVTSVLLQLLVLRLGQDGTGTTASNARMATHIRNGMTAFSPVLIAITSFFPAAVLFYWTTNNLFSLGQAVLLKQTLVKKLLKIPAPPTIAAPPEEAAVDPNPTIKETLESIPKFFKSIREQVNKMGAETSAGKRVAAARQVEAAKGARAGTGLLSTERIHEPTRTAAAAKATSSFLEATAAPSKKATNDQPPATLTAAEIKRRRVEQARASRRAKNEDRS